MIKKSGTRSKLAKGDNPLAGPFYVEGAEPGDTLAVKILDLQVDGDTGSGRVRIRIRGTQRDQLHALRLHRYCPRRSGFITLIMCRTWLRSRR